MGVGLGLSVPVVSDIASALFAGLSFPADAPQPQSSIAPVRRSTAGKICMAFFNGGASLFFLQSQASGCPQGDQGALYFGSFSGSGMMFQ